MCDWFAIRTVCCLTLAVVLTSCWGCQKAGVPLVPVKGKVTYGGGAWPKPGTLYFAVKEPAPDMPRKPGIAQFGVDGKFSVRTFTDGDGLVPGKYVVNIECWEVPPSMGETPGPGKSYVPQLYQSGSSSNFMVDVPLDAKSPVEVSFDVPKQ